MTPEQLTVAFYCLAGYALLFSLIQWWFNIVCAIRVMACKSAINLIVEKWDELNAKNTERLETVRRGLETVLVQMARYVPGDACDHCGVGSEEESDRDEQCEVCGKGNDR